MEIQVTIFIDEMIAHSKYAKMIVVEPKRRRKMKIGLVSMEREGQTQIETDYKKSILSFTGPRATVGLRPVMADA